MNRKDTLLKMIRNASYVEVRIQGTETYVAISKKEARHILNDNWKQIDDWTLVANPHDDLGLELVYEEGIGKHDLHPSYLVSKIS